MRPLERLVFSTILQYCNIVVLFSCILAILLVCNIFLMLFACLPFWNNVTFKYGLLSILQRGIITMLSKVIAVANQKGGVAKSTTSVILASILKDKGYNVLLVDADPQCSTTDLLSAETKGTTTLYDLLKGNEDARNAVQTNGFCDIIPCDPLLKDADQSMNDIGKEYKLREALEPLREIYDYIVVDTPPNVGILLINTLTAADTTIVPTQIDRLSLNGLSQFFDLVRVTKKYTNNNLRISGILATRHASRTVLAKQLMSEQIPVISEMLGVDVFNSCIRESVVVRESQYNKIPLSTYAPHAAVTQDYLQFVEEFLEKELKQNG
jgi:chromosome partitioning protein